MSPAPHAVPLDQMATCSPCATGAHLICSRKSGDQRCGCATCYPSPAIKRTIIGLFADLAVSLWRTPAMSEEDTAAVEEQVQRAVRHQLAHENIDQWMLSPTIAAIIMAEAHGGYWSLNEFTERITATGIDPQILNSPYVIG